MSTVALALAAAALLLAAICAVADGALRSLERTGGADSAAAGRERAHRTLAFARLVAHLIAGAAAAVGLGLRARPPEQALLLALAAAVLAVTVAEAGARALGDVLGAAAARRLAGFVRACETALAPAVVPAMRLEGWLRRMLRANEGPEEEREVTAEQFHQVIAAEADVSRDEERLLHGVFSMGETAVSDVMVPRVDIVGIERETPWSEVIDRVRSSEHARFPVYDETIDEVVGILYAKDLLHAVVEEAPPTGGWMTLVRPPVFIPSTKAIDVQLREFKDRRTHIAIVVDEYGGTAGLVTIEDILEEIVGDIRDEYDVEEPAIEQREGRRFWVSGRVTLDELSEALAHNFNRDDVTTVGGLVYEQLGRVPKAGEQFLLDQFRVVVERVRRRRVERVYFERAETLVPEPSR